MIQAHLKGITKDFGGLRAVDSLNLDINKGEILAILGPSGCGKSTLLQLIAGLERPNKGYIRISGETVFSNNENIFISPNKRQIALVFQNYALWPHFNVFENIAYPLKIKKFNKKQIKEDVMKAISLVKLDKKENRYPYELSGGEQQRVALARALVMEPKLLLLDESLSNLDAKLKEEMICEIKRIQKEMGLTIVHVTHDQNEAMSIADRIAIMNKGKLVQIGKPREIYNNPKTKFIASFIGKTNIINVRLRDDCSENILELGNGIIFKNKINFCSNKKQAVISVRPEDIKLSRTKKGMSKGKITSITYRGSITDYELKISDSILNVQTNSEENYNIGEEVWFDVQKAVQVEK